MKRDTKDWIKKTAGTSALIASPGILAGTLLAGPLGGLAVGGAVAAGNVLGSAAYKKAKEIREDVENRRKFRELQKHVLAENGILYYQPIKDIPTVGVGDMSLSLKDSLAHRDLLVADSRNGNDAAIEKEDDRHAMFMQTARHKAKEKKFLDRKGMSREYVLGKDMSLSKEQLEELERYKQEKELELAKAKVDARIQQKLNFGPNLQALLLRGSGTGDFALTKIVGNTLYGTKLGQVIDKGIALADNLGEDIIVRNGHTIRGDFKKVTGFSEDSLLSVNEEELKKMKDDIEFTSDPDEKDLKKSRYLSMLDECSRECLIDMLKEKSECCEPCEPVGMFSESPNLQSIVKGRDFGILGNVATAFKIFTKGSKAAKATKVADALAKATPTVSKAVESTPKGGFLGKIAEGVGKAIKNTKEGFASGTGKAVADTASESAKKGAEVAEKAIEKGAQPNLPGFEEPKAPDVPETPEIKEVEKPKTRLSEIQDRVNQGGTVNKYELKGLKMAGNSQASARLGEAIGYENLGKLDKTVKTVATNQAIETARKNEQKRQQQAG